MSETKTNRYAYNGFRSALESRRPCIRILFGKRPLSDRLLSFVDSPPLYRFVYRSNSVIKSSEMSAFFKLLITEEEKNEELSLFEIVNQYNEIRMK